MLFRFFFLRASLNRFDRNFIHLMIICVIQIDTNGMLHSRMCDSLFSRCTDDLLRYPSQWNNRLNACNANLIQVLNKLFLFSTNLHRMYT